MRQETYSTELFLSPRVRSQHMENSTKLSLKMLNFTLFTPAQHRDMWFLPGTLLRAPLNQLFQVSVAVTPTLCCLFNSSGFFCRHGEVAMKSDVLIWL